MMKPPRARLSSLTSDQLAAARGGVWTICYVTTTTTTVDRDPVINRQVQTMETTLDGR